VKYLLDTNIVSELTRRTPQPEVVAWAASVPEHAVSAVTVEELWFGIIRRPDPRVFEWVAQYLRRHAVLPVTADIAERCGKMRGDFSRRGITRHPQDMLIAATAQAHNLTLVTRNVRDFEHCGIALLNPFTA